jgi:hypothetical protein
MGAVSPLPQYAFMAWCSVRGSTGVILPFYLASKTKLNILISFHFNPSTGVNLKALVSIIVKIKP